VPRVFFQYIKANLIFFVVSSYIVFSSVLNLITGIDICIPCIFKTVFNIECPGCGLTRAFISLLELDFVGAYHSNALIFIVLPVAFYFMVTDFSKFVKIHNQGYL
jgi:hypothetical protein